MSSRPGRPGHGAEDKAEPLLRAAKKLFLARGYAATSMDDVAKSANASKTTLYSRYPNKAALFASVIQYVNKSAGLNLDVGSLASLPLESALYEIGMRFTRLVCSSEALRLELIYQSEGTSIPELSQAFISAGPKEALAATASYFTLAKRKGLVRIDDPQAVALQFLILLKGDPFGIGATGSGGYGGDSEAAVRRVVKLILHGISPDRSLSRSDPEHARPGVTRASSSTHADRLKRNRRVSKSVLPKK